MFSLFSSMSAVDLLYMSYSIFILRFFLFLQIIKLDLTNAFSASIEDDHTVLYSADEVCHSY